MKHIQYFTTLSDQDKRFIDKGLCQGVYVPQWKDVEDIKRKFYEQGTETIEIGRHSYLKHQDLSHEIFFSKIRTWLAPALQGLDTCTHAYPTGGSSEAFRYVINQYGNQKASSTLVQWFINFVRLFVPDFRRNLYLLHGEYEGYYHYATDANIPVTYFRKELADWKRIPSGSLVIISEPSAIDGNYWEDLEYFLRIADERNLQVWIDVAYHGTTTRMKKTSMKHSCIQGIFFSFSKSFGGCFYDRIGGIISKKKLPGMIANAAWFKNAPSFKLATMLLDAFPIEKQLLVYADTQEYVIEEFNKKHRLHGLAKVLPSDVFLLGYRLHTDDQFWSLQRGNKDRFVFSPTLDRLVNRVSDDTIYETYKKYIKIWRN